MAADEFFVGYLPTPPGLRRRLMMTCAAIAVLGCVVVALLAAGQRDPGPAEWKQEATRVVGVLHLWPYPFIEVPGENRAMLLVRPGKVGTLDELRPLDGRTVEARGLPLVRNDLMLLELDDGPDAVSAVTAGPSPASNVAVPQNQDIVVLKGEIVDPKCFGGAMKPGDGKTHKACAVLCLRGGIPPTFVTADRSTCMVLTDPNGEPLNGAALERILPFVGDPIELHGRAVRVNELPTLSVDLVTIRRL